MGTVLGNAAVADRGTRLSPLIAASSHVIHQETDTYLWSQVEMPIDVEIDTFCISVVEQWIVQSHAYAQPTSLLIFT